MTHKTIYTK